LRRRIELLPPFGGLLGFAPGLVELHDVFGGFGEAVFALEDCRIAGLQAFVAGDDQRLGFGVLALV
jgi:hypothetical protein